MDLRWHPMEGWSSKRRTMMIIIKQKVGHNHLCLNVLLTFIIVINHSAIIYISLFRCWNGWCTWRGWSQNCKCLYFTSFDRIGKYTEKVVWCEFHSFLVEQKKNQKRKMHDDLDDDMDVKPTMKYKGRTTTFVKFSSILCMLIFQASAMSKKWL